MRNLLTLLLTALLLVVASPIPQTPDFKPLDTLLTQKISQSHITGCVLGIYNTTGTLYRKSYGTLIPKYDLYAPQVTLETIFDIGYLTQVVGLNSGLMDLIDAKKIEVKDRVGKHLSEFDNNGKHNITIENLLLHNSGLQATIPHQPFAPNPAQLLKKINNLKLEYKQETKYEYSELGPVILGQLIAKVNKKSLNQSLHQIMYLAGLKETGYCPSSVAVYMMAPSYFFNGQSVRGRPGNRIANFLDGIAGNAGLFSILDNLGSYMQLMLNKGKRRLELPIFSEATVNLFTTRVETKHYQNTRALGWQTLPLVDPPCGHKFSKNSFGIADPNGSYLWADKDKNITIVFLAAGGGYPFPTGFNMAKMQGQISDLIMTILGY